MAAPTFSGTAILDTGGIEAWGDRGTRYYTGSLPGVNGIYVQTDGFGGQPMVLTGYLTAATHALITARYQVMSIQENDVGTYVGCDGSSYTNMLLRRVTQAGQFTKLVDDTYMVKVRFEFVRLVQ